jgi:hypothetical protein
MHYGAEIALRCAAEAQAGGAFSRIVLVQFNAQAQELYRNVAERIGIPVT